MIDNIKISLCAFTGSFDNCRLRSHSKGKEWVNYYLLRSNKSNAPLALGYHIPSCRLNIRGSIRKWYFEDTSSTQDLSAQEAKDAIEEIAELLLISPEQLRQGNITQCELGLNIPLQCSASVFTSTLVAYSTYDIAQQNGSVTFYRRDSYRDKERSAYKRDAWKQKVACIYDKIAEVGSKSIARKKDKQAYLVAQAPGILRIEFILPNRQAFKNHKIGQCSTLGGLLDSYDCLYEVWAREYKKLFFQSKLDRDSIYLVNESEREIVNHLEKVEPFFLALRHFKDLSVKERAQVKAELQSIISLATHTSNDNVVYRKVGLSLAVHEYLSLGRNLRGWEIKNFQLVSKILFGSPLSKQALNSIQRRRNRIKREVSCSNNNKGKKYIDHHDKIT